MKGRFKRPFLGGERLDDNSVARRLICRLLMSCLSRELMFMIWSADISIPHDAANYLEERLK